MKLSENRKTDAKQKRQTTRNLTVENNKCKICRRLGQKLFLKGERCFSPKCAMVKRPYAPGMRAKKTRRSSSEYATQLREKQRVKGIYGLREAQFRNYVLAALAKKSQEKNFADFLMEGLELRLDNAIFRLGIANSRQASRQIVGHGHILVNGRKINKPSFHLKIGDVISIRAQSQAKKIFQDLRAKLKKFEPPAWLKLDKEKIEGKVVALPTLEQANISANLQTIGEFYSR